MSRGLIWAIGLIAVIAFVTIPSSWTYLYLSGVNGIHLDKHPIADWALRVWPTAFSVPAQCALLSINASESPWKLWQPVVSLHLLFVWPLNILGPVLLYLSPWTGQGWVPFLLLYPFFLWIFFVGAKRLLKRWYPGFLGFQSCTFSRIAFPLVIVGPPLMTLSADIMHINYFNTWP